MTRDGRSLLLPALLIMYGLLAVESRYREDTSVEARRHRHRHRHETSPSGRNRHEPAERRSSWSREVDYDYDDLDDNSGQENEDEYSYSDEDYGGVGTYRERSYSKPQRKNGYHERSFESRYPRHHRESYHGWYRDEEKRRTSSRYDWRNRHRSRLDAFGRSRHRGGYSRTREEFRDELDEENAEVEEKRLARRYDDDDDDDDDDDTGPDNHSSTSSWRNSKKHRSNWRRDWRSSRQSSGGYRNERRVYDANDLDSVRKFRLEDHKRRRANSSERNVEDYAEGERDEEEREDIWKEVENEEDAETEDDDGEEEEELDNDFYKNENKRKKKKKSPLNTYDDIIRRLTSEDPSTVKPTVKRDYRNVGTDKYHWRLSYDTNNGSTVSRNLARSKVVGSSYAAGPSGYPVNKKPSIGGEVEKAEVPVDRSVSSMIESASAEIERKPSKNVISVVVKDDDEHSGKAKTKSLEQDYDEYLNTEDNEKDEDLVKAGIEDDSGMQSDVINTDYNDDETTDDRESTSSSTSATTSTSSTTIATTSSTSTTSTTTTTPKPTLTQRYDYRDTRSYDSGTGIQYNGYQAKNDYPPMSAHSVHKWQSLGTRESVKETRSNMQQFNKNGRSAEIREALQHAIKVSREGSCQWPRPRVIPVRDVYPSPSITYIPHCAILHRCSDDTGCCRSEALTCVPKNFHRVELSFYMTSVAGSSVVEKLSFYNHTECECKEKSEYNTNDKFNEQRLHRHYQHSPQPQNMRKAPPRKSCRCPSEFTPRITSDGKCQCHCFEHNQNCIKARRGKGYLSLSDRLCIQNNECATPTCEFGEYIRREGRCPRKRDRFEAIANFHASMNHRYRS